MHMTTLEITHSRTPEEIFALVEAMRPTIPTITSYTFRHRSRLVKPMLSYDLAAIAMSFLPAAGEEVLSPLPVLPHPSEIAHPGLNGAAVEQTDVFTYHHLRRDIFNLARSTGVDIDSRYVVPARTSLPRDIWGKAITPCRRCGNNGSTPSAIPTNGWKKTYGTKQTPSSSGNG
jgi:hypothetical protein